MSEEIILPPKIKAEAERTQEVIESQQAKLKLLKGVEVFRAKAGFFAHSSDAFDDSIKAPNNAIHESVGVIKEAFSVYQVNEGIGYSCVIEGVKGLHYIVARKRRNLQPETAVEMGLIPPLDSSDRVLSQIKVETNQVFSWLVIAPDDEKAQFEFLTHASFDVNYHEFKLPDPPKYSNKDLHIQQSAYAFGIKLAKECFTLEGNCFNWRRDAALMATILTVTDDATNRMIEWAMADRDLGGLSNSISPEMIEACVKKGFDSHSGSVPTTPKSQFNGQAISIEQEIEEAMRASNAMASFGHRSPFSGR